MSVITPKIKITSGYLKLKVVAFKTKYWRPKTDFREQIVANIKEHVDDGDIIAVSEKAIATATSNIVDESNVNPSGLARFLAEIWIKKVWGGPLGRITRLKTRTLENLREYPSNEGAAHKQVALNEVGFLQALRHYSEGGIDASNLPYSYVSLPLGDPNETAFIIREAVKNALGKDVSVMIVDGDSTFSWRNLHLAPRYLDLCGLVHFGGFLTFVLGRISGLRERKTPVGYHGLELNPDRMLWFASLFHRVCGKGAGRTVWSMSERMGTSLTGITWEMLELVAHKPVALIRVIED